MHECLQMIAVPGGGECIRDCLPNSMVPRFRLHGLDATHMAVRRMLEAAMLGLPYSGRMPDFSQPAFVQGANGGDAAPLSPSVRAQRKLRQEQDDAFHASLKVTQQPVHGWSYPLA